MKYLLLSVFSLLHIIVPVNAGDAEVLAGFDAFEKGVTANIVLEDFEDATNPVNKHAAYRFQPESLDIVKSIRVSFIISGLAISAGTSDGTDLIMGSLNTHRQYYPDDILHIIFLAGDDWPEQGAFGAYHPDVMNNLNKLLANAVIDGGDLETSALKLSVFGHSFGGWIARALLLNVTADGILTLMRHSEVPFFEDDNDMRETFGIFKQLLREKFSLEQMVFLASPIHGRSLSAPNVVNTICRMLPKGRCITELMLMQGVSHQDVLVPLLEFIAYAESEKHSLLTQFERVVSVWHPDDGIVKPSFVQLQHEGRKSVNTALLANYFAESMANVSEVYDVKITIPMENAHSAFIHGEFCSMYDFFMRLLSMSKIQSDKAVEASVSLEGETFKKCGVARGRQLNESSPGLWRNSSPPRLLGCVQGKLNRNDKSNLEASHVNGCYDHTERRKNQEENDKNEQLRLHQLIKTFLYLEENGEEDEVEEVRGEDTVDCAHISIAYPLSLWESANADTVKKQTLRGLLDTVRIRNTPVRYDVATLLQSVREQRMLSNPMDEDPIERTDDSDSQE